MRPQGPLNLTSGMLTPLRLARGYATQAALNDQADFRAIRRFASCGHIGAHSWRALATFAARLTLGAARRLKMTCGNWAQGTRADAGSAKSWRSWRIF